MSKNPPNEYSGGTYVASNDDLPADALVLPEILNRRPYPSKG